MAGIWNACPLIALFIGPEICFIVLTYTFVSYLKVPYPFFDKKDVISAKAFDLLHVTLFLIIVCWWYLQIVPGYYLRRDSNGQIENSAAVNNTASEHFMVDRLIVDDLLNWAVNYKVSRNGKPSYICRIKGTYVEDLV